MNPPADGFPPDDRPVPPDDAVYTLEAAAELSGIHPGILLELGRARVVAVVAGEDPEAPRFDTRALYRLRQIEILRQERSLSMHSVRFVIDLIERLEAAERELRTLRERMD